MRCRRRPARKLCPGEIETGIDAELELTKLMQKERWRKHCEHWIVGSAQASSSINYPLNEGFKFRSLNLNCHRRRPPLFSCFRPSISGALYGPPGPIKPDYVDHRKYGLAYPFTLFPYYPFPPVQSSFPVMPDPFFEEGEGNVFRTAPCPPHFFNHTHGAVGVSCVD